MNFVNEIFLLNPEEKSLFRKLEKVKTKIIKCKYSIIFNKTCLKENFNSNIFLIFTQSFSCILLVRMIW